LDRVQKAHPILKNTHWGPTGELLENGEVSVPQLLKNLESAAGQPVTDLVKAGLRELLAIRLDALEKSLGASVKQIVEKEVARLGEILR
jgi:hypothetical protein